MEETTITELREQLQAGAVEDDWWLCVNEKTLKSTMAISAIAILMRSAPESAYAICNVAEVSPTPHWRTLRLTNKCKLGLTKDATRLPFAMGEAMQPPVPPMPGADLPPSPVPQTASGQSHSLPLNPQVMGRLEGIENEMKQLKGRIDDLFLGMEHIRQLVDCMANMDTRLEDLRRREKYVEEAEDILSDKALELDTIKTEIELLGPTPPPPPSKAS